MNEQKISKSKRDYEECSRGRNVLECWRKTFPWVSHLKIDDLYGKNSNRVEESLRQLRLERAKKKKVLPVKILSAVL